MGSGVSDGDAADDTALLLFAHGTPDGRGSMIARQVAEDLRHRDRFAEVAVSFTREWPSPADVLARLESRRVLVSPLLACDGRLARKVLPERLAEGPGVERCTVLPPVGVDPRIADLARAIVDATMIMSEVAPERTSVLVAGHGSRTAPGGGAPTPSQQATERVVAALAADGRYAQVAAVYLSQAPFAQDWRSVARCADVMVVPFFISGGHHEEVDLPELLRVGDASLDGRPAAGRRVWLTTAVGRHPALADLVHDAAVAALRNLPR